MNFKLFLSVPLLLLSLTKCESGSESNTSEMNKHAHTNALADESSPYLLQHAHNPINWYPWGEEALAKAEAEDKPIIISIGYSACHWCHVMERESFEDTAVARIMNENFVCIKVDREERPDIDQVYMDAVQLMTGRGGWPLNCIATPDGKPFFGGTYFPKADWINALTKLSEEFAKNKEEIYEYSDRLTEGVKQVELISLNDREPAFQKALLDEGISKWKENFDPQWGGPNRAPKFPIPNNLEFLLQYAKTYNDADLKAHVDLSLQQMAYGGIYDQLGGGFARYSTDSQWKVPHFEKMLYDNAQLISLYSKAYQSDKKDLYNDVIKETIAFVERELSDPSGAFYSALDADSEGEEGKFYVWKKEEVQNALGEDFKIFSAFYNVNTKGHWENGNHILLRDESKAELAKDFDLSVEALDDILTRSKIKLMDIRSERERPGLDDKSLCSWNALMIKAYVDAYMALGDKAYLAQAEKSAKFVLKKQRRDDYGLYHNWKNGKASINGYLEDYCFMIEALISLYQASFNIEYLYEARTLAEYSIKHFFNNKNKMFYFTSSLDPELLARKVEITDNVIPASNSSMAKGLFYLGHYLENEDFLGISQSMLNNVYDKVSDYPSGYSNWMSLSMHHIEPFYEIAISGEDCQAKALGFGQAYLPNKMLVGDTKESQLPLLEYKFIDKQTTIYVCVNKACQLPVTEVSEALKQIK